MRRIDHIRALCKELGAHTVQVERLRKGWPSLGRIRVEGRWIAVAIHIGEIGLSHRQRDNVERRFQNPGQDKPMSVPSGFKPLLLGLWYSANRKRIDAVVGMDSARRIGVTTRFSLFVPLAKLKEGATAGWADHISDSGEAIHVFRAEMLPVFAALRDPGDVTIPEVAEIIEASGLLDDSDDEGAAERARKAALRAARRSDFGKWVVAAYGGCCAMCGLNSNLIDGAHLYPVGAPASPDKLWNGIALCPNHHRAFDRHQLYIRPGSREVVVHPALARTAQTNTACASLVQSIKSQLIVPSNARAAPRTAMLIKRYEYFTPSYDWAS